MVTWDIAENNPGALAFMMDAYGLQPSSKSNPFRAEQAFNRMKHHCITGVNLYILWNDCCGRDTAKAIEIMCEKEIDEIRKHLNHGMTGIPFEDEKDLPSAETDVPDTNVGDLISRQAAIDALIKWYGCKPNDIEAFEEIIEALPSAQPEILACGSGELVQESDSLVKDCISRQEAIDSIAHATFDVTIGGRRGFQNYKEEFEKAFVAIRDKHIEALKALPSAEPEPQWIPVSERLPECEQKVLVCTKKQLVGKDVFIDSIVTPAIYEDGTMRENESEWHWEDIDFAGWDEEEDCGIIPEGWWENRHFNPDGVYNNPVDRKVIAWMPLPEPYHGTCAKMDGGGDDGNG